MRTKVVTPERFKNISDVPFDGSTVRNWVELTESKKNPFTISQILEQYSPTDPGDRSHLDGSGKPVDAFTRAMAFFDLRTKNDMVRGIPASELEEFFYQREKNGSIRGEGIRAGQGSGMFTSNDPQSWILFPEYIQRTLRVTPLPQDILGEIVSRVVPIDSVGYKSIYLEDTRDQRRMRRVAERGEFPTTYLQTKEHDVTMEKYGLQIEGTYEYTRRVRLDLLSIFLQRIAAQSKLDQAEQAIDVILNGDGNANSSPAWNLTTLDPNATSSGPGIVFDTYLALYQYPNQASVIAKQMTYHGFLKYKATTLPLNMNVVVGRLNELMQVIELQFPNINPLLLLAQFNQEGVNIGSIQLAQDIWSSLRLVYMPFMVGGTLLGLNKDMVLEELVEMNSNIVENARNILNQTMHIIISQVIGFNKVITEASSALNFQ